MGWQARSKGTYEERKNKAIKRNKFNADHLEALKMYRDIEELKEREIQIENGTYKPPNKRRINPVLESIVVAGIIGASFSSDKKLY